MSKEMKELLDKTGRFLIEKRGTMPIKVNDFHSWKKCHAYHSFSQGKGDMTTYWLLEELESKCDYMEKNFSYVQPSSYR